MAGCVCCTAGVKLSVYLASLADSAHSRDKKLLFDLFSGAGGSAYGYWKAGWEVVGFDTREQPRYPYHFVQLDALSVLEWGLGEYADAFHASPPCKHHTRLKQLRDAQGNLASDGDFLADTRDLLEEQGKPWILENVPGAPMPVHALLCGTQFGLGWGGRQLQRHRWFESNIRLTRPGCQHSGTPWGIYGRLDHEIPGGGATPPTLDAARSLMGISWMNWHELKEAIPPVYTEYLGKQLLGAVEELDTCLEAAS